LKNRTFRKYNENKQQNHYGSREPHSPVPPRPSNGPICAPIPLPAFQRKQQGTAHSQAEKGSRPGRAPFRTPGTAPQPLGPGASEGAGYTHPRRDGQTTEGQRQSYSPARTPSLENSRSAGNSSVIPAVVNSLPLCADRSQSARFHSAYALSPPGCPFRQSQEAEDRDSQLCPHSGVWEQRIIPWHWGFFSFWKLIWGLWTIMLLHI